MAPLWGLSPLKPTSCIAPKPNFSTYDDYWVQPLPVTTYFSPLKIFDFLTPARKKGDQMDANFEGTIGRKMTTFSTAHPETQNLKADMLRSIYVVYLRFRRDRLIIFRLAFPAQKVAKNRRCQKLWILDQIFGFPTGPHHVSWWKSTHAENPVLILYQCIALDPYFS